jgi:hypothetical protein
MSRTIFKVNFFTGSQCWEGEWQTCARRLQRAAGELMPAKEPTSGVVADSTPESDVIYHDSDWL